MKFIDFRTAVQRQFDILKDNELFCVEVDRDLLYATYLNSFPDGTNKLFRERTEHDCNCCKNFIRDIGHVVAIVDGKLKSGLQQLEILITSILMSLSQSQEMSNKSKQRLVIFLL